MTITSLTGLELLSSELAGELAPYRLGLEVEVSWARAFGALLLDEHNEPLVQLRRGGDIEVHALPEVPEALLAWYLSDLDALVQRAKREAAIARAAGSAESLADAIATGKNLDTVTRERLKTLALMDPVRTMLSTMD